MFTPLKKIPFLASLTVLYAVWLSTVVVVAKGDVAQAAVQTRQGAQWTDTFSNIISVADAPNLRAGAASLFVGTYTIDSLCDRDENGVIVNRAECITSKVAGCIFSAYGIYRLGGGFVAAQSVENGSENSIQIPSNSSVNNSLVIQSAYSVPEGLAKRGDAKDHYTLSELSLESGTNLLNYTFNNFELSSYYMEDEEGASFIRAMPRNAAKRDVHHYMDIYYQNEERGVEALGSLADDDEGKGRLSSDIAGMFMANDEYPNDIAHDYYYSTVCMGLYNMNGSRMSKAKLFLNEYNQFPDDIDSVYSGIDPCWEYTE